jgi:hypothetical protein
MGPYKSMDIFLNACELVSLIIIGSRDFTSTSFSVWYLTQP